MPSKILKFSDMNPILKKVGFFFVEKRAESHICPENKKSPLKEGGVKKLHKRGIINLCRKNLQGAKLYNENLQSRLKYLRS